MATFCMTTRKHSPLRDQQIAALVYGALKLKYEHMNMQFSTAEIPERNSQ